MQKPPTDLSTTGLPPKAKGPGRGPTSVAEEAVVVHADPVYQLFSAGRSYEREPMWFRQQDRGGREQQAAEGPFSTERMVRCVCVCVCVCVRKVWSGVCVCGGRGGQMCVFVAGEDGQVVCVASLPLTLTPTLPPTLPASHPPAPHLTPPLTLTPPLPPPSP